MNVIAMLNNLAESLRNNFDRINNGGCCVAAGMIGKYLKQYVPVRIAVSDYRGANGKNIDVIREIVNNSTCPCVWNDEGNLDFSHVIIEFEGFVLEMSNGDGVGSTVEAYTRDEKVGKAYKEKTKNWGSYRPFKQTFVIVSSIAELEDAKLEKVRERALNKLTPEEKVALGLI